MPHTPGPWKSHKVDNWTWEVRSEDYGTIVTLHAAYGIEAQRLAIEPDAHLIAAAPALLAACKLTMACIETGGVYPVTPDGQSLCDYVASAIAAAEPERKNNAIH